MGWSPGYVITSYSIHYTKLYECLAVQDVLDALHDKLQLESAVCGDILVVQKIPDKERPEETALQPVELILVPSYNFV